MYIDESNRSTGEGLLNIDSIGDSHWYN